MSISKSKNANVSHYLGIDFGKSKIGLAVADSETRIAFVYGVLKNDKRLLQKIAEIVEKEGIGKIVIGNAGVETRHCLVSTGRNTDTQDFASKLIRVVETHCMRLHRKKDARSASLQPIQIEFQNEMFTTQLAQRNLIEKGVKKIKRFDDQEAARIILQSWLDTKTKSWENPKT